MTKNYPGYNPGSNIIITTPKRKTKVKRHWGPKVRKVGTTLGRGTVAAAKGTGQFLGGMREGLGIPKPTVKGSGRAVGTYIGKGLKWAFTDPVSSLNPRLQVEMCRYLSNNYPDEYNQYWTKGLTTTELLHKVKAWEPLIYQEALQVSQNKIH